MEKEWRLSHCAGPRRHQVLGRQRQIDRLKKPDRSGLMNIWHGPQIHSLSGFGLLNLLTQCLHLGQSSGEG
jgi:hypothetical protein